MNNNRSIFFFLFLCGVQSMLSDDNSWTWHYKKLFSAEERAKNQLRSDIKFEKTNAPLFSQMIVSWNAKRPSRGFFTLWGQARDAKTKKWHDWHKMLQWGAHVQRSFFSEKNNTTYNHVRLEIPTDSLADGLRLKVVAEDEATLDNVHALFVCISNYSKFKNESPTGLVDLLPVKIDNIPQVSQMELVHDKKEVLCSPTSCSMMISYFTGCLIDPVDFANHCFDDGLQAYGSWPYNMAHAYELTKGTVFFKVGRLNSFRELHKLLLKKIPVVVSVRGLMKGAPQEYKQGHLLVVIGWNAKDRQVICIDPAFDQCNKTLVYYDAETFICAWERSRRLAYLANPCELSHISN